VVFQQPARKDDAVKFSYYPGCSLHSTAQEYEMSIHAVCNALAVELEELPDWSCCGASSAHCTDFKLSLSLPARNLAIAETRGLDVAVGCAACFLRFKTAAYELRKDERLKKEIVDAVGMPYQGTYRTRHLLDIICNDIGETAIREKVQKPLADLKVVSYYGCLLVRPPKVTEFGNPENPVLMDGLMEWLGAAPRDWAGKVDCCGGSLALTRTDIVYKLVDDLMTYARRSGAACIVTACPLCQANLDTRQESAQHAAMPIFYFTELLGLAMGLPDTATWFKKHIISPSELLKTLGLL
jgi:heterodisulfide reductase subunit B